MSLLLLSCLCLLRGAPAASEEVYTIGENVLAAHAELRQRSHQSALAVSRDGRIFGGTWCDQGGLCRPHKIKERALSNCRRAGGQDCVIFSFGDRILVRYVVVQAPPSSKKTALGDCLRKDGSRVDLKAPACRSAGHTYSPVALLGKTRPKDEKTVAREQMLADWIDGHSADFRRLLNGRLQRSGPLPESGLGVHAVRSFEVRHRNADDYEVLVTYVLTRSGLSATSSNYNRPTAQYDQTHAFDVRFDGSQLRFL